jgi:hypothetical protein
VAGVYILKNNPGALCQSADVIRGKNMKRENNKGGKCEKKKVRGERKKGERKHVKWKLKG